MNEERICDLFPGWGIVRVIGSGSYGTVYEIARDDGIVRERAALKVITVPQNPSEIEALYDEGYDDRSVTATFKTYLDSIVKEYTLMRELSDSVNVVKCDDIRYIQHDDSIGWDIYIRMELLTPLTKALGKQIAEAEVVRIGRDLSRALTECARRSIVHRDIKPQNIFVSENGDYKLGDFGIARTMDKTTSATVAGTYDYMAPEVYYGKKYGASVDVYSLGMVLYWLLNERRTAFLKLSDTPPSAAEKEEARTRRLRGDPLPPPAHGSLELKRIVRRACAFDPKDRYRSAEELLEALEALGEDRQDETVVLFHRTKADDEAERERKLRPELQKTVVEKKTPRETPQRNRLPAIAAIALGAVLIILAAALALSRCSSTGESPGPTPTPVATPSPTPPPSTPTPLPAETETPAPRPTSGESAYGTQLRNIRYDAEGRITGLEENLSGSWYDWEYLYDANGDFRYRMRNIGGMHCSFSNGTMPGTDIQYSILDQPVYQCVGFEFNYSVNLIKGTGLGTRRLCVMDDNGNWKDVSQFEYDSFTTILVECKLEDPRTLAAFATPRLYADDSAFTVTQNLTAIWVADTTFAAPVA